MKAKKYIWSMICVYMAYLTHGMQALIFSQNQVNFATKWGFDMSNPESAAYAAGVAAVSTAIAWTGFGKFISVWIGGEISDRVGRKKLMYGAQQYTKAFGLAYCGLSEMQAASMTTMYQVGSIVAVAFWAVMMSKLKWHPLKVLIVDAVITAGSLLAVLLVHQVAIVYIAILILGFGCAGGALQTGLSVLQEFVPGPKGRNTGIYYTFMGAASYLMPVIVAKLTVISGESKAVYTLMTLMFILAVVQVVATLYLILRYKKVFGTTPLAKAK